MSDYTATQSGSARGQVRTVTAFFDSRDAADKARADLVAAGLSPDTINVAGGDEVGNATAPSEEGGFWHALKEFFMPDEDRYAYAEGLRRGGFALSVRTGEAQYDRALDILDADGAVDIDERERSWRSEGWTGFQPGVFTPDVGIAAGDASTAGFGASRAGEDGYADTGALTGRGSVDAESRADAGLVGTGANEPGLLNPDFRERIGSGTASMTPPTPTGSQDATVGNNAATRDRSTAAYDRARDAEDATLGSPTRSGAELPSARSTIGSSTAEEETWGAQGASGSWSSRRDENIQRARVRGYIIDPDKTAGSGI